jgi:hypothetical protein
MRRLKGVSITAPQHRARGRHYRIHRLEIASEDRCTGIADSGEDDGDIRDELAPDAVKSLDTSDEADARHAGDHAEEFSPGWFMPGNGDGDEKGEDRGVRIEDGGEAGIDGELGPGDEVKGKTLLSAAWMAKRHQLWRSRGRPRPLSLSTTSSRNPAMLPRRD